MSCEQEENETVLQGTTYQILKSLGVLHDSEQLICGRCDDEVQSVIRSVIDGAYVCLGCAQKEIGNLN